MSPGNWTTAPVPSGWRARPIADVVVFPSGQVDPRTEPYRSMVLVAPDHIESRSGTLIAKVTAADQGAISGKYLFARGDTLYSKIRPYLRKAVLADFDGLTSADMYPLRPTAEVEPRFLLAVILGEHFSRFSEIVSMRSGFPKINREEFAEYSVALPPLPEQRRIAEILDTLDEAIRKTEQLIAKLKQVKKGLLHDLLTRGIDDNGELRDPLRHPEQFKESPLGLLPKQWRCGLLANFIDGSPQNGLYKPANYYADQGTPIIRIDSFYDGLVAHESRLKRVRLTEPERGAYGVANGDLLVNRVNSIDYVGKAALVADVSDAMVFESNIMRFRVRLADVLPEYAIRVLCSPRSRAHFKSRAKPAIAQVSVNQDDVRELPFYVPSLAEQAAIVHRTRAISESLDFAEAGLAKLRLLKLGLMEDLLTGRVRVTNLLSEAAA
jgi:type I restriction enzyme, S subunit